ncbi:MAG: N-acetylmuramoyl-L-alanine amidase [Gammaproteobacteria bacterium]|nr:N-acetylmuramoyl-L-alanine amidase [Gammaproteobacteria bacterium]
MRPIRIFFLSIFLALPVSCWAHLVSIDGVRMWPAPDYTRLVFDLSGSVNYRLFTLTDPYRLVLDLHDARLRQPLPPLAGSSAIVADLRTGARPDHTVRIVADLKINAQPRSFLLKPAGPYGHRLVVDLYNAAKAARDRARLQAQESAPPSRDFVVVIDPGHGGEDPGATGPGGVHEKTVVLAIGRDLDRLVSAHPGWKAIMTRTGDYYVPLVTRRRMARGADVFISIHANSEPGDEDTAHGAMVFALSEKGATSAMARALASNENESDWIGGVNLDGVESGVGRVLGDLTKSATIADSLRLGDDMLPYLRRVARLHSNKVQQAGFVVLESPVPSILIETGFINDPRDERRLINPRFQEATARAIFKGLERAEPWLLARRGVPLKLARAPAAGEYVVRPGDTLDSIAQRHDVSVTALRNFNDLSSSDIRVGLKLRIPLSRHRG